MDDRQADLHKPTDSGPMTLASCWLLGWSVFSVREGCEFGELG